MKVQNNYIALKLLLLLVGGLFFALPLKAQYEPPFTIDKGEFSDIERGGTAVIDGGWLRLTSDAPDTKGWAFIDKPFSAPNGVYIEFEYKSWRRTQPTTWGGGDGFSVFLYDGNVAKEDFRIGYRGGSLSYSPYVANGAVVQPGLKGAFLGIGLDEYGGFSWSGEQWDGLDSEKPNSIVLRGSEANNYNYITHNQLSTNKDETNNNISVSYNTVTSSRPEDNVFYKKVKIFIERVGDELKYRVRVMWETSVGGADVLLIDEVIEQDIPEKLKIGFAASTGGAINYHEIGNLYLTIIEGGVRVNKSVDKVQANVGEQLTYTIDVYNDNNITKLEGLVLKDVLTDENGNAINLSTGFEINSVTFNNNSNSITTASGFTSGVPKTTGFTNLFSPTNPFTTNMDVAPHSKATFTIVGTVKSGINNKILKNKADLIVPSSFPNSNQTINHSEVTTRIGLNPTVDLKIEKTVDNDGIVISNNQTITYTIKVTNVSAVNKPSGTVTVKDVVPAGLNIRDNQTSGSGWSKSKSGQTLTFTRSTTLNSGASYPDITVTVRVPKGGETSWINTANLSYANDTNEENNSSSVRLRRRNYWRGNVSTDWSNTSNWTSSYVPGLGDDIEFATSANFGSNAQSNLDLDQDRTIGNLINNSTRDLVVTAGNQLIVNGTVATTNTGKIVVKASPDTPSGTLKFTNPASNTNVDATVEFYSKAYAYDDCGVVRKQWQYFGIPIVQSATFPIANVAGDETINLWNETANGNKWLGPVTANLGAFKGYQITNNSSTLPTGVYSFTGKLNVGDATISLTKTANVNYPGVHLIGNSFTAAIPISWEAITFPDGGEQIVYLFNTGTRDQWRRLNGKVFNKKGYSSGQYMAVPVNLSGWTYFPYSIPATHAFMVVTDTPSELKINYDKLIKNSKVKQGDDALTKIVTRSTDGGDEASESKTGDDKNFSSLVMDVIGEESADRVWIIIEPSTTHDFDNGWDGRKMLETGIVQLYVNTATDDSKLQVATVPELNGVSLGFVPEKDGEYTFDFSASGILKGADIYLHDAVTGTSEKVGDEQSYTFSAKKGDAVNRFVLTSAGNNRFLSVDESLLEVVATNKGEIMIVNGSRKTCMAFVYNSKGDFLQQIEVKANSKQVMKDFAKGAYMVRLQNSEVNDVRRVTVE